MGCQVGQIAKALIFCGKQSNRAILVIASGAHRMDEKKLTRIAGERLSKPDADFVREQTGYVIGGVPPLGHSQPLTTYVDEALLHYPKIWAAAGYPNAFFQLTPHELVQMTGGQIVDVAQK